MAQEITAALRALLKQKLQVGNETFMGELVWRSLPSGETEYRVTSMDVSFSLGLQAAQLTATIPLADTDHHILEGFGSPWFPNDPVRAYAWYGDPANRVCIFTGLLDRLEHHRDPSSFTVKARSRMKWLLEQRFQATAPQGADEDGAVRTEDNGVYLGKTIEYIINDILDRAGWPADDRSIAGLGLTADEYVLPDDTSWAECIVGAARLSDMEASDLWEDPLGVIHYALQRIGRNTHSPLPTEYRFEAGRDVLALDYSADDEDRATRAIVTGPMTTSIPAWTETW
jgi:hypothetical protein